MCLWRSAWSAAEGHRGRCSMSCLRWASGDVHSQRPTGCSSQVLVSCIIWCISSLQALLYFLMAFQLPGRASSSPSRHCTA